MTTLMQIDLKCPCCGHKFQSEAWASTNVAFQATDFRQMGGGLDPLPLEIHTCLPCGYTGHESDFGETKVYEDLKELIQQKITPIIKDETVFADRQYEFAAWITKWRGAPSVVIGELYHKAAWCCEDRRKNEEGKNHRRQAIEHFKGALQKKERPQEKAAIYICLIGELYRRTGEKESTALWFDRVPQSVGNKPGKQRLLDLAGQQKTKPKKYLNKN